MNFDELYKEHYDTLKSYAYRFMRNNEDAEDVVQDTFLKACQSVDTFNHDSSVTTWLMSICRNESLNKLKKKRKENKALADTADGVNYWGEEEDLSSPEAMLIAAQSSRDMFSQFEDMPGHFKDVLKYRYVDELSYKAISEKMSTPINTVRTWIHRARLQLLSTISPR